MYTVGSLFSGIGGIDLAFSRAGFDVRWQVEIDPYCQKVLKKHTPQYWPNAKVYSDVKEVGASTLESVDVMVGGFPCQDISAAGKGAGIKEGTRSGLWLEFARIIGEVRPRYVLLENVAAITGRDGTRVIADLAALGYGCEWGIVAASDVGAPHGRKRWFCVAYSSRGSRTEQSILTDSHALVSTIHNAGCGTVSGHSSERILIDDRVIPGSATNVAYTTQSRSNEQYGDGQSNRQSTVSPIGSEFQFRDRGRSLTLGNPDFAYQGHGHDAAGGIFQDRPQTHETVRSALSDTDNWATQPVLGRVPLRISDELDRNIRIDDYAR